jgi:hypothetical protein
VSKYLLIRKGERRVKWVEEEVVKLEKLCAKDFYLKEQQPKISLLSSVGILQLLMHCAVFLFQTSFEGTNFRNPARLSSGRSQGFEIFEQVSSWALSMVARSIFVHRMRCERVLFSSCWLRTSRRVCWSYLKAVASRRGLLSHSVQLILDVLGILKSSRTY